MKKTIKSTLILLYAALFVTACNKSVIDGPDTPDDSVFNACLGSLTRTYLGGTDNTKVFWEDSDEVSINGAVYSVAADENDKSKATLTFKSGTKPEAGPYTAYYPASIFDGTAAALPEVQNWNDGKITNNPMYAYSENKTLSFHNVCALFEFVINWDATITGIEINDSEKALSGEFTVVNNAAVLTDAAQTAHKGVKLVLGDGIAVTKAEGKTFHIAIPAGEYSKLTIKATASDGRIWTTTTKASVTVNNNIIYELPITPLTLALYNALQIEDVTEEW